MSAHPLPPSTCRAPPHTPRRRQLPLTLCLLFPRLPPLVRRLLLFAHASLLLSCASSSCSMPPFSTRTLDLALPPLFVAVNCSSASFAHLALLYVSSAIVHPSLVCLISASLSSLSPWPRSIAPLSLSLAPVSCSPTPRPRCAQLTRLPLHPPLSLPLPLPVCPLFSHELHLTYWHLSLSLSLELFHFRYLS